MVFYNSARLKGEVLETWIQVTSARIKRETVRIIENEGYDSTNVNVTLDILEQEILSAKNGKLRGRLLMGKGEETPTLNRLLQLATPLFINYTTLISFPSEVDSWDANKMVAAGFISPTQQEQYIYSLRAQDSTFNSMKTMIMEVNDEIVTDDPLPLKPDEGDNYTIYYAIAGAAGGVCICALLAGGIYYAKRRSKRKSSSRSSVGGENTYEGASHKVDAYSQPQSSS
jgi:hypothetical protein